MKELLINLLIGIGGAISFVLFFYLCVQYYLKKTRCDELEKQINKLWIHRMMMDLLSGRRPAKDQPAVNVMPNEIEALLLLSAYTRNQEYFVMLIRKRTLSDDFRLLLVQTIVKPDFNIVWRGLLKSNIQDENDKLSSMIPARSQSNPDVAGHQMIMQIVRMTNYQHVVPIIRKLADLYNGDNYYLNKLGEERLVSMAEIRAYKLNIPDLIASETPSVCTH